MEPEWQLMGQEENRENAYEASYSKSRSRPPPPHLLASLPALAPGDLPQWARWTLPEDPVCFKFEPSDGT